MDNDGNKRSFDRLPNFELPSNFYNAKPTEKEKSGLTSEKRITKGDGVKKEVFGVIKFHFADEKDTYDKVSSIEELDVGKSFSNVAGSRSLKIISKRGDQKEKVDSWRKGKAIGDKHKQQELNFLKEFHYHLKKMEIIQSDFEKFENAIETSKINVSEYEDFLHEFVHKYEKAVSNKTRKTWEKLIDLLVERQNTASKILVKLKEMAHEVHSSATYESNFKINDDLPSLSTITKEVIILNRKMELKFERYKCTLVKTLQPLLCHTEPEPKILKYKELLPDKVYQYLLSVMGKVSKYLKNAMFLLESSGRDATNFSTEMTGDSKDTESFENMRVEPGKGSLEESRRDQTCIFWKETMNSNVPELFKRSQNQDATEANAKPDETHIRQPQSPNTKSDLNRKLTKFVILVPNTESEIAANRAKELMEPDNSSLVAFVREQLKKLDEKDIDGVLEMVSCNDTDVQIPDSNILHATVVNEVQLEFVKTNYTVVVMTAEMFEEALEETRYVGLELTHSNIFPDNIRMFRRLPVIKGSYIHQKPDQKPEFVRKQLKNLKEEDTGRVSQMVSRNDTDVQVPERDSHHATVVNEVKLEFVKTNFTVVVVAREMFEEALEETRLVGLELTSTTIYRPFYLTSLRLPVIKFSYLHQKDVKRNNQMPPDDKD